MCYVIYLYIVFFWDRYLCGVQSASVFGNFNKYGNVKIYLDQPSSSSATTGWPDAIKLINGINKKAEERSSYKAMPAYQTKVEPRLFAWQPKDLVITLKIPLQNSRASTRLVPPISWLEMSGSKVIMVNDGVMDEDKSDALRVVEITTERECAERTLSVLKFHGFNRESIFRVLDKGPWLLAIGISKSLPRLYEDMGSMGLNQSQITHVLSHCPYLIAQYARYKGRDVIATIKALYVAGYTPDLLMKDIIRFPSMLSATPDRINGWRNLLAHFGVGNKGGSTDFCSLLRRSPFMYYVDASSVASVGISVDLGSAADYMQAIGQSQPIGRLDACDISHTSTITEPLEVLRFLWELRLPDLDKIIRSRPDILLTDVDELLSRVNSLYEMFSADVFTKKGKQRARLHSESLKSNPLDSSGTQDNDSFSSNTESYTNTTSNRDIFSRTENSDTLQEGAYGSGKKTVGNTQPQFTQATAASHAILMKVTQSYPIALSVPSNQLRSLHKVLRTIGLRKFEIMKLLKNYPPVLKKSPQKVKDVLEFLRYYCGFRTQEIVPFLLRSPSILEGDVPIMKRNVAYLFKSLGATTNQLINCPAYLACDMHKHVIPRAEFLRTRGKDPLFKGLHFFVNSAPRDLAQAAGIELERYFPLSPKIKVSQ